MKNSIILGNVEYAIQINNNIKISGFCFQVKDSKIFPVDSIIIVTDRFVVITKHFYSIKAFMSLKTDKEDKFAFSIEINNYNINPANTTDYLKVYAQYATQFHELPLVDHCHLIDLEPVIAAAPSSTLVQIDNIFMRNDELIVSGWGTFNKDTNPVPPDMFMALQNNKPFKIINPNDRRVDVNKALNAQGIYGFVFCLDEIPWRRVLSDSFRILPVIIANKPTAQICAKTDNIDISSQPIDPADLSQTPVTEDGCLKQPFADMLNVIWALTVGCNYRCSYCSCRKTFTPFSSFAELTHAVDVLLSLHRPAYKFTIYGGEPTCHPCFNDLLSYITAANAHVYFHIITNASKGLDYLQHTFNILKKTDHWLVFSCHLKFVHTEDFVKKVKAALDNGMRLNINLMMEPNNLQKLEKIATALIELRDEKYQFVVYPIYPYLDPNGNISHEFTDAEEAIAKDIIAKFGEVTLPRHTNSDKNTLSSNNISYPDSAYFSKKLLLGYPTDYKAYYCVNGSNVIFIKERGFAKGGTCAISSDLGNIYHDEACNFVQCSSVIQCSLPRCLCVEDYPLPKFMKIDQALQFKHEQDIRLRNFIDKY